MHIKYLEIMNTIFCQISGLYETADNDNHLLEGL